MPTDEDEHNRGDRCHPNDCLVGPLVREDERNSGTEKSHGENRHGHVWWKWQGKHCV